MAFRGLRHWKEARAAADANASSAGAASHGGGLDSAPPPMALDAGAVHVRYHRALDWQEALVRGIAAFGAGRGRPAARGAV
jgi:hypothetical protein